MKCQYNESSLMYRKEIVFVPKIWGDLLELQPSRIKKIGEDREKRQNGFLERNTHKCVGPEVKKKESVIGNNPTQRSHSRV